MKARLGSIVRDRITGFEGVVIAVGEYLNGCVRLCVQSQRLQDGKPADGQWIDEDQLWVIGSHALAERSTQRAGGPKPEPHRAADPPDHLL